MRKPHIGIIGYGFVGQAVAYGFNQNKITIVDPKYNDNKIVDVMNCDVIFICVPTPMAENGSCDVSILEDVLDKLRSLPITVGQLRILKSTVSPGEIKRLGFGMDRGIPVFEIYNPEFLTERGAMHDFVNPQVQIFGGQALDRVETLYREHSICSPAPTVFRGTAIEASIIKYMINTFLAMKVEFFNEWAEVADKYGANFAKIANAVGGDPRIGMSHTKVPGPDGKLGFGGACFPKDLSAILYEDTLPLLAVTKYSNNQRRMAYERDSREIEQGIKFKS